MPASLWSHRGARVSAHHTSALHLLLTHPSICALCPPHPPTFPCVEAAFTAQRSRLFLHLFPSRLLFLCLKGKFAVSTLHRHPDPPPLSPTLFFSPFISCPVSVLEGKVLCQGRQAKSVSHVTRSEQRVDEPTAEALLTQRLCRRSGMLPGCSLPGHSNPI